MAKGKIKSIAAKPTDHPLVALCKQHGNDASDLRDAAHEIFHARYAYSRIDAKDNWDREVVHKKLTRALKLFGPAGMWIHEIKARVVEQLVCKHFSHPCDSLENWIHVSIMEALKFGLPYAEMDISLPRAERYLTDPYLIDEANRIIALVETQPAAAEAR